MQVGEEKWRLLVRASVFKLLFEANFHLFYIVEGFFFSVLVWWGFFFTLRGEGVYYMESFHRTCSMPQYLCMNSQSACSACSWFLCALVWDQQSCSNCSEGTSLWFLLLLTWSCIFFFSLVRRWKSVRKKNISCQNIW